mgnify:CR=1 FL=1
MANYATNIFYASTENQNDLNKIEAFLDENSVVMQASMAILWMQNFLPGGNTQKKR